MKPIIYKISLWILTAVSSIFLTITAETAAQNIPLPESLTLSEAIKIAVDQNPEIKAARFQVEMMKSEVFSPRSILPRPLTAPPILCGPLAPKCSREI